MTKCIEIIGHVFDNERWLAILLGQMNTPIFKGHFRVSVSESSQYFVCNNTERHIEF